MFKLVHELITIANEQLQLILRCKKRATENQNKRKNKNKTAT